MVNNAKPLPGGGFTWIETSAGPALVCRPLGEYARHLFTTRPWALGSPTPDDTSRARAWHQLAEAIGVADANLARLHQVHGCDAVTRTQAARSAVAGELPKADIIVSDDPTIALAIQTADCVPILLADRKTGAVTAAHAGWRGLAAHVPGRAVEALRALTGSLPEDFVAAIGPAISAANYEVGQDVRERFGTNGFGRSNIAAWFPSVTRPGHWLFDGWGSARDQLCAAGVPSGQIHVAALCTATHADLLCSYRRDGTHAGRMAAAIRRRTI